MSWSKRILFLITTTLVVFIASVFLMGEEVQARPLFNVSDGLSQRIGINSLIGKEEELKASKTLVGKISEKIEVQAIEMQKVVAKKEDLAKEVTNLKEQIQNLDDMFVYINRYAPDSMGNTYAWGNCTLYVKNQRPDISNSWGNANTWYSRAQAQGWNVGIKPKKGAVATTTSGYYGHVAFVESVSLDGAWITISEMNYVGLNITSRRKVHYTEFRYIYELD